MCTDVTTVYPILSIILACDISSLQAKAMIPNEMPDGKKIVAHTQWITAPRPQKFRAVFNKPLLYLA